MKFADTGWWVAWALSDDRLHLAALAALDRAGQNEQLLTTDLVAGEAWTFLRRKAGHGSAVGLLDRIDALVAANRVVVHRVDADQSSSAWRWLRRHDERVYSYVDATSFQVMRDRRLREAFAFDGDFSAAGFVEVR